MKLQALSKDSDAALHQPHEQTRNSGYLPTLDGWRAIAILGVLLCHSGADVFRAYGEHPEPKMVALFSLGAYGVAIFFGISGFLITCRLLEENERYGNISLKNFYIRRAGRILPASLTYLFAIYTLQSCGILYVDQASWVGSIFFFKNFVKDHTWYLSHFWSLSVEEQFYFFWPCVFLIALARWRGKLPALLAVLVLIAKLYFGKQDALNFDGLLWGGALAFVISRPAGRNILQKYLTVYVWAIFGVVLILGILGKLPYFVWWGSFVIALVIVGTVIRPNTAVGVLLELPILKWIGRFSYSLYLWQQLFCLDQTEGRPLHQWQEFPFNITASFITAAASFYLIEKPMIRFAHRMAPPVSPGRNDIR